MSINGLELWQDGVQIPEVNGEFVIPIFDVYDFGAVRQLTIKNVGTIEGKNLYVLITGDSSDNLYGIRFASITYADGTGETQNKLYLKNNNMLQNELEMFQLKITPVLGIDNIPNMLVTLVISNHVINVSTYQKI